jgi:acetyl-CoA carboxylase biotin carboxyl carrier protein
MKENDLNTVDVRDGAKRIVLKRGAAYVAPPISAPAPASTGLPTSVGMSSSSSPERPSTPPPAPDDETNLTPIKSPMVGTVYLKPAPDAKAYVNAGEQVGAETVVCLIEAMKVFNEIKAELTGTIAKVLVTDGQTVEFGQPLFLVQ